MRLNLPVTPTQYDYPADELLVSSTNLKGEITHCNAAFQRVSGFEMAELLGQPHNLIRHPDMPAAAYKDLWRTIGRGQPWMGLVKNRRKNGDHYWVRANVTPIMQDGKPREYLSVRTKPTAQEIAQAEALYAAMRQAAEQGRSHVDIVQGRVYPPGWRGKAQRLLQRGVLARLLAWLLVLLAGVLLPDVLGLQGPVAMLSRITLFIAIAAGLTAHFRKFCLQPIEDAAQAALQIAGCNLNAPIANPHTGALGLLMHGIQQIQINLQAVVGDVRSEIHQFINTTDDIAQGSDALAQRVDAQVQTLEQTTAAMEHIASTVEEVGSVTQRMAAQSHENQVVSGQGSQVVAEVGQAMEAIRASSARMGEITATIESIAFQTNLLALNAAVEAARAGEQGRGFAVVASEVRALAQRSADAAKEINALIGKTLDGIHDGHARVAQASRTIGDLVQASHQASDLIGAIGQAAAAQQAGIGQVNMAVQQMDEAVHQNAELARQSSSATDALRQSVRGLKHSVGVFTL